MPRSIIAGVSGGGLFSRAMRASAITVGSFGFAQGLRLVSNLILTRLLFPEAFGMMALVSVVMIGLVMFSDIGLGPAISQHPDGDDPAFLNTAFTINVVRGAALWLVTFAAAWPLARLYGLPELTQLLPAAGLTLLISGFNPTRIETANRHLLLGRVAVLDLVVQVTSILAMTVLAYGLRSVWALVIGGIFGAVARVIIMSVALPGPANRIFWDAKAGRDLIRFGKWIFLSSACGFLLSQGDKAILGAYLPLNELGIYNIGYFLAAVPVLLANAVTSRILIPLYRDHPPSKSAEDAARLRRLRFGVSAATLAMLAVMGLFGVPLIGLLYDARYAGAGAIVVVIACVQMPGVVGMTYDQAALAAGDSRNFFWLIATKALVQTVAFLVGVQAAGLFGGLVAQALALVVLHGPIVMLAVRHRAWDPLHDLVFFGLAAVLAGLVIHHNAAVLGLM